MSTCSDTNMGISKYVIPLVVLSQHFVQCAFPSTTVSAGSRTVIALLHILPIAGMMYQFGCSVLVDTVQGPSICWGGHIAEMWQILVHAGIVAVVFVALMPPRFAAVHVLTLAGVMSYLYATESTLALGSKWCSYCLIYSVVYILDPYWAPKDEAKKKQ